MAQITAEQFRLSFLIKIPHHSFTSLTVTGLLGVPIKAVSHVPMMFWISASIGLFPDPGNMLSNNSPCTLTTWNVTKM